MRNRRYETVFILAPDLDEGKKKEILDRLDGVVERGGGIRVKREDWGVRRLAYPVNHHPKGAYYLLDFVGPAQVVAELERHMRMIESVFRFLTVKTEDRVDLEAVRKEQTEEREKEAAREASLREAAAAQAAKEAVEPDSSEAPAEDTEEEEASSPEKDSMEDAGDEADEEDEEEKQKA